MGKNSSSVFVILITLINTIMNVDYVNKNSS